MAIDPSIALGVRPQQGTDLLGDYGKALQLKSLIGQQQLLPEQLKAAQLENQQKQIQIKQMADTAAAFKSSLVTNPDGTYDIDPGRLTNALGASGSGQAIPAVLEGVNKYKEGIATLQEAKAKVAAAHVDNGGAIGAAVKAANYDPHLFGALVDHGVQEGAIDPKGAAPVMDKITKALAEDPTGETARQLVKQTADTWLAQSPKQQELGTAAQTAQARTQEADLARRKFEAEQPKLTAETTSAQAKATLDTAKANLVAHPEQYAQIVDTLFPNDKTGIGARTKQQVQFYIGKGQIDEANRALDNAVETANAPAKAASVAAATAPINISEAVAKETDPRVIAARTNQAVTTAKALRMGDNPAIQRVPPAEVGSVMSQAQKLDEAAIKTNTTTEAIGKVLDLATSGNKAAGANIPLVGVGALNAVNGIKRINSAEIAQYGTAGSLLDKIQGKLQGWTEGQPISQDIIDDMRTLHQMLGEQGYKTYTDSLNSLNDRTGSAFKPNVAAPNIRKATASPHSIGDSVKIKGKDMKITKVYPDGTFDAQ